jgi:molybdenum cofactor cytidylyltransferase
MIEGIVLAAGYASRMGENKMLLPLGGKTILQKTLENMMAFVECIYVISGHEHEAIAKHLEDYEKVKLVYNPNYPEGMLTSIKIGVDQLKGKRAFIMPGDMPFVKTETFKKLIQAKGPVIIPSYHFKGGHPILVKTDVLQALATSHVESLRDFLNLYEKHYVEVEDEGVCIDIDTRAVYEYYKRSRDHET